MTMEQQFMDVEWPGWEVVRKLGQGSYGSVYEIQRRLPDGRVERSALKKLTVPQDESEIRELSAQSFSYESITAYYKQQMSELVSEYSLAQELNGSRNVVACHDVRYIPHEDGIGWDIYIRMELLRPLKMVLGKDYRESNVIKLGLNLCNALTACQKHAIIHRDIKPENILVSHQGEYKLGDFGIAKVSEKNATGTMTGTMSYMAPEVANHAQYGFAADIYSLGMVLYWMMNEQTLPFLPLPPQIPTGFQRQEATARRLSGEALPDPVHGSPELKRIVRKACAFSQEERYATAGELAQDLRACHENRKKDRQQACASDTENQQTLLEKPMHSPREKAAMQQKQPAGRGKSAGRKKYRVWLAALLAIAALAGGTLLMFPGTEEGNDSDPVVETTAHVHEWAEATCTAPKTCRLCGLAEGEALGHTSGEAKETYNESIGIWETQIHCGRCGEILESASVSQDTLYNGTYFCFSPVEFITRLEGKFQTILGGGYKTQWDDTDELTLRYRIQKGESTLAELTFLEQSDNLPADARQWQNAMTQICCLYSENTATVADIWVTTCAITLACEPALTLEESDAMVEKIWNDTYYHGGLCYTLYASWDAPRQLYITVEQEHTDAAAPEGSAENPYPIASAEDLENIRKDLSAHYVLTQNIVMDSDTNFTPIGEGGFSYPDWSTEGGFSGTLDGNGYTIYGLKIHSQCQCAGLFATITPEGCVRNLSVKAELLTQDRNKNNAIAAIAGYNAGVIENCFAEVTASGFGKYVMVGGIAACNAGTIRYCQGSGSIQGNGEYPKVGSVVGDQKAQGQTISCVALAQNQSSPGRLRVVGVDEGKTNLMILTKTYTTSSGKSGSWYHSYNQASLSDAFTHAREINAALDDLRQSWLEQKLTVDGVKVTQTSNSMLTSNNWRVVSFLTMGKIRIESEYPVEKWNYVCATFDTETGKTLSLAELLKTDAASAEDEALRAAWNYLQNSGWAVRLSRSGLKLEDIAYYLQDDELILLMEIDGDTIFIPTGLTCQLT